MVKHWIVIYIGKKKLQQAYVRDIKQKIFIIHLKITFSVVLCLLKAFDFLF